MKQNTRRGFLKLMGASPLAAKAAAEEVTKSLVGIGIAPTYPYGIPVSGMAVGQSSAQMGKSEIAKMLMDAAFRSQVESASYRRNRHVSYLDLDLATKRSFSLAAKATFQRQRNVQREIEEYSVDLKSPWEMFYDKFRIF